jgi:hypothetical protein
MTTILVKGLSDDTLRRLKRLKVDLDCKTWAELLDKLARNNQRRGVVITKKDLSEMKQGVNEFISLANRVSNKWRGSPTVLEESRAARRHDVRNR